MRCAIYCRVSTEEQAAEGHSIEAQRQELIKYSYALDLEVFDFYIDAGYSAATMNRPELQRMLGDSGKFDVVLVWRLDRISRDMADLMKILEVFQSNNVAFKSKTENFDTSTASGKLMLNMLGSFAEFERASISERIKMAHQKILNEGKWRGGPPPFGYRLNENKTLEICEDEAKIVRLMFEWSADKNYGTRTISVELNKLGLVTRNQKPFSSSYVTRILKNPTYSGQMIYGKQKYIKKNGKKQAVYTDKFCTYKGLHEPIISEEIFLKSSHNMGNRKLNRGTSGSIPNPIGGLIFCGDCKDYMLRGIESSGDIFFVCRRYKHFGECSHHHISQGRILKEIKKATARIEENKDKISEINKNRVQQKQKQINDIQKEIENIEKQILGFAAREDTLFDLIEKRLISEDEFVKRKRKISDQRVQSNQLLQELRAKLEKLDSQQGNRNFIADIKSFNKEFDNLSTEEQKKILQRIIERIEVMGNEKPYARKKIELYFRI